MRYKLKMVSPNKANNIFTFLLVFGTSVSLTKLVSGLLSSEEALFIEQEIEKYLRIDDEPVRGEIPR